MFICFLSLFVSIQVFDDYDDDNYYERTQVLLIILNQCVIIIGELKGLATNSRLMLGHYYRADRLMPDFHISKSHITALSNRCHYF